MMLLDDLFEMGGGYVLNFSDRTFSEFFANELQIDIDAEIHRRSGTSKGKRLRCFFQTVDKVTAARTLRTLWEYREAVRRPHRPAAVRCSICRQPGAGGNCPIAGHVTEARHQNVVFDIPQKRGRLSR